MTQLFLNRATGAFSILCFATACAAWAQGGPGPIGFASMEGGTPGGDPSNLCMVINSDEASLRAAIECTQKRERGGVVRFGPGASRPIELRKRIELPSNITLQGPATLQTRSAGILHVAGQRNIIISDLVLETLPKGRSKKGGECPDPMAPDTVAVGDEDNVGTTACTVPITIQGAKIRKGEGKGKRKGGGATGSPTGDAKNIWVDHNTFLRCGDKCITIKNGAQVSDGRFTGADNITISNNRFRESFFGILITVHDNSEGGARNLVMRDTEKCALVSGSGVLTQTRVSVYGNLFDQVRRRMVRVAYCNSYAHQFNNVILGFGMPLSAYPRGATCDRSAYGFGPSAHSGGRLLLENNHIAAHPNDPKGCKAAVAFGGSSADEGFVKDVGNLYLNGAFGGSNKPERVMAPPYPYTLLPAGQVLDTVKRNAGVRNR